MNKTRQREYIRRKNRFKDPSFKATWKERVLDKDKVKQEDALLA